MIRKKRGSLRFKKIIFLLSLFLFFLVIFLIFRSGFFNIKQIEISGDKVGCAANDQLKNVSGLYGQNFFLLNIKKLQENFKEKFICIRNVSFNRIIPDIVKIEVNARKPVAVLFELKNKQASPSSIIENIATPEAEVVGDRYMVDNDGVIFSKNIDDVNIPKIYIYDPEIAVGRKLENSFIDNALKALNKMKEFGVVARKSWIIEELFIVNPDTSDPKIIFRLSSQIDIQLASLQLILTEAKINHRTIPTDAGIDLKELTFIDLRFDKPIVRFAPKNNG